VLKYVVKLRQNAHPERKSIVRIGMEKREMLGVGLYLECTYRLTRGDKTLFRAIDRLVQTDEPNGQFTRHPGATSIPNLVLVFYTNNSRSCVFLPSVSFFLSHYAVSCIPSLSRLTRHQHVLSTFYPIT